MKICVYLEYYHFAGGRMFKNVGTGILSSYHNQISILKHLGIDYTENVNDNYDIFQCSAPWLRSIFLMKRAKRRGKKVIVWSHTTVEDSIQVFRLVKYIAPIYRLYLTRAYNLADLIFAPTEYTKSLLVGYGIPANKIIPMSNGVDLSHFYQDPQKRITGRKKYDLSRLSVITVSLAIPRKGINTFVKLARDFPDLQFRWYGKIYNSLIAESLPNNLPDNIKFTGFVPDILESYCSGDIFVFPSYEENEGMAILEAASIGLPILVRDIPVYNGWLENGKNCLKAKNDREFKEDLKKLIDNPTLRQQLGNNALKLAQAKSIEAVATKTKQIYRELLKNQ